MLKEVAKNIVTTHSAVILPSLPVILSPERNFRINSVKNLITLRAGSGEESPRPFPFVSLGVRVAGG